MKKTILIISIIAVLLIPAAATAKKLKWKGMLSDAPEAASANSFSNTYQVSKKPKDGEDLSLAGIKIGNAYIAARVKENKKFYSTEITIWNNGKKSRAMPHSIML